MPSSRGTSSSYKSKYASAKELNSAFNDRLSELSLVQNGVINDVNLVRRDLIESLKDVQAVVQAVAEDEWISASTLSDLNNAAIIAGQTLDIREMSSKMRSATSGMMKLILQLVQENEMLADSLSEVLTSADANVSALNNAFRSKTFNGLASPPDFQQEILAAGESLTPTRSASPALSGVSAGTFLASFEERNA